MVDVLPDEGYVSECQEAFTNANAQVTTLQTAYDDATTGAVTYDWSDVMSEVDSTLEYAHQIGIWCFLAGDETLSSSTYESLFLGNNLILNLLFNMGKQYNDVMFFVNCYGETTWTGTASCQTFDAYEKDLGDAIGDFIMRLIYRPYYPDIELDFTKY